MTTPERQRARSLRGVLAGLDEYGDLPEALPADPSRHLVEWYEYARRNPGYDDFNAMSLATSTPDGAPSVRVVLCKSIEVSPLAAVFYTSYRSRKGRELEANPRAAAVFYWPHERRQARIEGDVVRATPEESDRYFRSRPLLSRIGAAASPQSEPLESRKRLVADAIRISARSALHCEVRRPSHWGGYRILVRSVELWTARRGRLHDRAMWTQSEDGEKWFAQRLGP